MTVAMLAQAASSPSAAATSRILNPGAISSLVSVSLGPRPSTRVPHPVSRAGGAAATCAGERAQAIVDPPL